MSNWDILYIERDKIWIITHYCTKLDPNYLCFIYSNSCNLCNNEIPKSLVKLRDIINYTKNLL